MPGRPGRSQAVPSGAMGAVPPLVGGRAEHFSAVCDPVCWAVSDMPHGCHRVPTTHRADPDRLRRSRPDLTFENVHATVRAPAPRGAFPAAASSGRLTHEAPRRVALLAGSSPCAFDPQQGFVPVAVKAGFLLTHDVRVPINWVAETGGKHIRLNIPAAEAESQSFDIEEKTL